MVKNGKVTESTVTLYSYSTQLYLFVAKVALLATCPMFPLLPLLASQQTSLFPLIRLYHGLVEVEVERLKKASMVWENTRRSYNAHYPMLFWSSSCQKGNFKIGQNLLDDKPSYPLLFHSQISFCANAYSFHNLEKSCFFCNRKVLENGKLPGRMRISNCSASCHDGCRKGVTLRWW